MCRPMSSGPELYAEAHAQMTGQASSGPAKLIVPILTQFMASNLDFAKARRQRDSGGKEPI
jgi:hypothetical protein